MNMKNESWLTNFKQMEDTQLSKGVFFRPGRRLKLHSSFFLLCQTNKYCRRKRNYSVLPPGLHILYRICLQMQKKYFI